MAKVVNGLKNRWELLELIGQGDAGEVHRVRAAVGGETAVMKRPVQNVSGGTILRQATQITLEAQILERLEGVDFSRNGLVIHTPYLLDQAIKGTERTANFFIISEEVPGISVSDLLRQALATGKQLPQVLVLKVLSAALTLLKSVHAKGVLWNDVKTDHIFWDPENNRLSFIDWGNGLFMMEGETGALEATAQTDYAQLFQEGRLLLEQTYPELAFDIGWPVEHAELTPAEIDQLYFRVDYMQSYSAMRVVEYNLFFQRSLSRMDDLPALEESLSLVHALDRMGVGIDKQSLIEQALSVATQMIAAGEYGEALAVTERIASYFSEDAGANWQLGKYLLELTPLHPFSGYAQAMIAVLAGNWVEAIWKLEQLQQEPGMTFDLMPLMLACRANLQLPGAKQPTVKETLGEVGKLAVQRSSRSDPSADPDLLSILQAVEERSRMLLHGWELAGKGEQVGERYLQAREVITPPLLKLLELPTDYTQGLNAYLSQTRDLYHAWQAGDLQKCRDLTRVCFALEPNQKSLQALDLKLGELQSWEETLRRGPAFGETVNAFGKSLQNSLPVVEPFLGPAHWLEGLKACVSAIARTTDLEALSTLTRSNQWPIPWVDQGLLKLDMPVVGDATLELSDEQKAAISAFHQALKTNVQRTEAAKHLQAALPLFSYAYASLSDQFTNLFSALAIEDSPLVLEAYPPEDRASIAAAGAFLSAVKDWQAAHKEGRAPDMVQLTQYQGSWQTAAELIQDQALWQRAVLPILSAFQQRRWDAAAEIAEMPAAAPLFEVSNWMTDLGVEWSRIPSRGIYPALVSELTYNIDKAQATFLTFWQSLENHAHEGLRWLVRTYQTNFSRINQLLLQIARQLRNIEHALDVVNTPELARTRLAQNSAGDLMFSMVQLEALLLPPSRKQSVFKDWQQQYLELLSLDNREDILKAIQSVETIHPLLPWFDELVRRDADFFKAASTQRW